MILLPRRLNSSELPSAEWCNRLLECVQAITPLAGDNIHLAEMGSGTLIHAEPAGGGTPPPSFPGLVYCNFNRFYDDELVPDDEQIGTAILDNSEGEKEWIKIAIIQPDAITDVNSIEVSYEPAPDPLLSPDPSNEMWFRVADWSTPISIIPPTGADDTMQVYTHLGEGVYGWSPAQTLPPGGGIDKILINPGDAQALQDMVWGDRQKLPPFGEADQVLINPGGITLLQDMEWGNLPVPTDPTPLPSGSAEDVLVCDGGQQWRVVSPPGPGIVAHSGATTQFIEAVNEYEVFYKMGGALVCDELRLT